MVIIEKKGFINSIRKEMKYIMTNVNQRMGVYVLVSHLIITLAVIVLYGIGMFVGKDTTVLEGLLFVVFGYWFGAITKDSLKSAEKITDVVDKNVNTPVPPSTTINNHHYPNKGE